MALPRLFAVTFFAVLAGSFGEQFQAATQSKQQTLIAEWSHELEAGQTSPVKRVVNLLQKMKAELVEEANKEAEMYDKQVCWCQTNEKEKTQAVADAEARDKDLSAEIESRAAQIGERETEIKRLKGQIAADTEALKKATSIREDEAADFRGEEKDLVQAMTNLRNAIAVLGRHQGGNFLQLDAPLLTSVRTLLRDSALKYEMLRGDGHPRSLKTALLSISATAGKEEDKQMQELLNALNVGGSTISDALPLNFAESVIKREAHNSRSAGSIGTFLQAGHKQPGQYKSYSARSDGIYGIMTQMLSEFEAELKSSQKNEVAAATDYEEMAKAKKDQIAEGQQKLDDEEGAHAANRKALSDAKEDLALTREQRSEDMEFLRKLKVICMDLDKQWELRSKTRAAETKAVAETIAILTEDDNHEMLSKSVTFFQENANSQEGATMRARRSRAADTLRRAARDPTFEADDLLAAWHTHRSGPSAVGVIGGARAHLSTLAVSVQLDSFSKVKEMMDKMVAELKKQQQEEVDFKAYCTKEFNENEKATFNKNEEREDLEAKIEALSRLIDKLSEEIAQAKTQIADTEVEIKQASQDREKENSEFQTTIADQRATQAILKKALGRLKDFYEKGMGKEVFAQGVQTPPVQFNDYKTNAGASPVMGLIEQIMEDSKQLEGEATEGEYKAQADYETFVKSSNALIADLSESVDAKTKAIASAKQDTAQASDDLKSAMGELESLAAYEADLHGQCDFVLKNFQTRQKARLQEMEAIQEAKGILSGA